MVTRKANRRLRMSGNLSASEELFSVVRSYAEEWGAENILIAVPLEWEQLGEALSSLERTRLAFTTNGKIEVSAFEGARRCVHYEVDSEVILTEAIRKNGHSVAA
jgi:hypothetical protein